MARLTYVSASGGPNSFQSTQHSNFNGDLQEDQQFFNGNNSKQDVQWQMLYRQAIWYQTVRGCIQTPFPTLSLSKQRNSLHEDTLLLYLFFGEIQRFQDHQQLHSLLPFVLHAWMTTFLEQVNQIPEQFISWLTSCNTLTAYQGQIFLQYCFL